MITSAAMLAQLDNIEASYRSAEEAARLGVLAAQPGLLTATNDIDYIPAMSAAVKAFAVLAPPDTINKGIYRQFFSALDAYLRGAAATLLFGGKPVTALDQYLSYQNAAVLDSALVGPNVARLYWLYRLSAVTGLLSPGNVYAPLTQFGAATVGAGAAITYNDQASITTANAGNVQGYTASKGVRAHVTTAINGTLAGVVTGNGRDSTGAAVVGRTWAAVLDNAAVGANVDFTPTHAGDRLAHITGVTGAGAATAGAFTLSSILER